MFRGRAAALFHAGNRDSGSHGMRRYGPPGHEIDDRGYQLDGSLTSVGVLSSSPSGVHDCRVSLVLGVEEDVQTATIEIRGVDPWKESLLEVIL